MVVAVVGLALALASRSEAGQPSAPAGQGAACSSTEAAGGAGSSWQIQIANDAIVRSDNQFTHGIAVQKHSRLHSDLDATSGTPAFGKRMARPFLPNGDELVYRESWTFGHNIQTPGRLEESSIILNDTPYMGMLGWMNGFAGLNETELSAFGLLLGWVGPSARGGELQSGLHDLIGHTEPKGWQHELSDEPILNFYYQKRRMLVRRSRFDAAVSFDAALGNLFTYGEAGMDLRFGDVPRGFATVPFPVGRGLGFDATLERRQAASVYGSVNLRATRFLHALPREGNSFSSGNAWTQRNVVEPERWVGQLIMGAHIEGPRWAGHVYIWFSSATLEPGNLGPEQDADNSFGVVTIERRF